MASSARDTLALGGERTSGQDVRSQNVLAAMSVANIVKSSLGPVGLDKMLVDDIGVRYLHLLSINRGAGVHFGKNQLEEEAEESSREREKQYANLKM